MQQQYFVWHQYISLYMSSLVVVKINAFKDQENMGNRQLNKRLNFVVLVGNLIDTCLMCGSETIYKNEQKYFLIQILLICKTKSGAHTYTVKWYGYRMYLYPYACETSLYALHKTIIIIIIIIIIVALTLDRKSDECGSQQWQRMGHL